MRFGKNPPSFTLLFPPAEKSAGICRTATAKADERFAKSEARERDPRAAPTLGKPGVFLCPAGTARGWGGRITPTDGRDSTNIVKWRRNWKEMVDLRLGDCLELMKDIPDGSVDLVLTDPPYGTTAKN